MTSETEEPGASKVIAMLVRAFLRVLICGMAWWVVYFLSLFAASSAKTSPQPNPELGRTFHLHAIWASRHGALYADGYVKPWVGHWYHFVMTFGLILLILAMALGVAIFIARTITGEWE